jgi:hypothetical protein
MPNPDVLTTLGLWIEPTEHILRCCRDDCRHAISVDGSRPITHLRDKHNVPLAKRRDLTALLKTMNLRNPDQASPLADGSAEVRPLRLYDGYACRLCNFRTISLQLMKRHFAEPVSANPGCPHSTNGASKGYSLNVDEHIEYVYLQTWKSGPGRKYWLVRKNGNAIRPAGGQQASDHLTAVGNVRKRVFRFVGTSYRMPKTAQGYRA